MNVVKNPVGYKEEKNNAAKALIKSQEFTLVVFIVALVTVMGIVSDNFFTGSNFLLILRQMPISLVMAISMSLAIISGGMDLSIGSMLGVSTLAAGVLMQEYDAPLVIVLIIPILITSVLGLINGVLIAKLRVNPIIVTLGTMNIFKGFVLLVTDGAWYTKFNKVFVSLGKGFELLIIGLVVVIIFMVVMRRTKFGRHLYAIGSSENSAKLAGLRVDRIKIIVYTLIGFLCGIAGLMYAARTLTSSALAGTGYEMDAIAACVIGGVSITGGKGNIIGTFLGVVLMAVIFNGMTLMGISADSQGIVTAVVIILALLLGSFRDRLRKGAN